MGEGHSLVLHPSVMPELLAPAGGREQLEAAVRFGADAVYLAVDRFGMRARADNFTLDEARDALSFAHAAGVRVHVTLNTLMDASDIRALPAYCEALADAGADAFIVGDLGAFSVAQDHAPDVELHVSTQASVCNAAAATRWHSLGASRVVCAREMSLDDIADMRAASPRELQIEAFVHGAMCVAYSGRCLLSAAMANRSGNKGACVQSCRWRYALVEEKRPGEYFPLEEDGSGSYVLNAQDLNVVRHLGELSAAGVDSFKIEGRNKRAFYVATVVGAYRRALDGGDVQAAARELETVSHRPYGTGFYFGDAGLSSERDGYIREYLHAATVEACEPAGGLGKGAWRVTVLCRNRFFERDELEVLSPGRETRIVRVHSIELLVPADGGLPFVERGMSFDQVRAASVPEAVSLANRAGEHYAFLVDELLFPGDYLRRRAD